MAGTKTHNTTTIQDIDIEFQRLTNSVNLIFVFDHVGRAGNGFFLGIFDQHPEVLTSQWVHYIYSYIITRFGDQQKIDAQEAYDFIVSESYFKFVFQDKTPEICAHIYKAGGDPNTEYDRKLCRETLHRLVHTKPTISRGHLVIAAYYAMMVGMKRDSSRVKYIMVADSVSLREEHVMNGFSGKVLSLALQDFPNLKALSLVRDPRAMFASSQHQFVNVLGNMYGVTPTNVFRQLKDLFMDNYHMYGTVWPFWLVYGAQTTKCIYNLRKTYAKHFTIVRNEDLNLHFVPTMECLTQQLEITMLAQWLHKNYIPTSMGVPWKGTGAYNSRYNPNISGILKNDPQDVAEKSVGPNKHVTERWKTKLSAHEIELLNILFQEELTDFNYTSLQTKNNAKRFLQALVKPFRGELPNLSWIYKGVTMSAQEGGKRVFYAFIFPLFYIVARIKIYTLYKRGFWFNFANSNIDKKIDTVLPHTHKAK